MFCRIDLDEICHGKITMFENSGEIPIYGTSA